MRIEAVININGVAYHFEDIFYTTKAALRKDMTASRVVSG
jgi:hypothetical protein